jgi:hypothetical protein
MSLAFWPGARYYVADRAIAARVVAFCGVGICRRRGTDWRFAPTLLPFSWLIGRHETCLSFTSHFLLPATVFFVQIKQGKCLGRSG